jgi:hypothetical protein
VGGAHAPLTGDALQAPASNRRRLFLGRTPRELSGRAVR